LAASLGPVTSPGLIFPCGKSTGGAAPWHQPGTSVFPVGQVLTTHYYFQTSRGGNFRSSPFLKVADENSSIPQVNYAFQSSKLPALQAKTS
jgi:hypothetical protein